MIHREHETAKIGADNPDNIYMNASISGARTYRLTGTRGTAPILSFGTKANRYAIDGTMASTGELDSADMTFGPDGSFEITVGPRASAGNWLPTGGIERYALVLRLYDTPVGVATKAGREVPMPAISTENCP